MVVRRHLLTLIRVIAILAAMAGAALTARSGVAARSTDPSGFSTVIPATDTVPASSSTDCDHDNDQSKDTDNDQNGGCT